MISVIVPVYKAEKYLHRCVDSILAQSYTDFELLLIDDGSPDNSGTICDEYAAKDSRVHVFHSENGGVSSARNLGLDNAKGEYVTFCDADDYVTIDWLSAYHGAISGNVDLAIQGIYYITNNGEVEEKKLSPCCGSELKERQSLIVNLFVQGVYGYPVVKLFRRQLIEENCLRFDIQSRFREDAQFFSEYLVHVKDFMCIDSAGYYYILPALGKEYKGNFSYSLLPICKSLDVLFNKKIPVEICVIYYPEVKTCVLQGILYGPPPSSYHLDLYKRMTITLGYTRGVKKRLVNQLIQKSRKFPTVSRFLLNLIRIITK